MTKRNYSVFYIPVFQALCVFLSFISTCASVFAKDMVNGEDSTSIINFYNPSGSFIFMPDANVHVNESEMKAGLLYDLENKKIVWQKEMNSPYPVASLTKMMVALLTVEDVHAGKIQWTDNVNWNRQIVTGRGKRKKISSMEVNYSLMDLFKAAMIASNNEAAEQIARFIGGDVQSFVDRMNTRARELGMNSTFYGNPTGLPAVTKVFDNASTPVDLLILTLEMLNYDEIMRVTGMGYADISNGANTSVIRNHNRLTIDYKGEVDGMKTGYTKRAGFCLAATSNKCEHRLISIVLGSRSPNLRNEVVKDMINDYYSSIGLDKLGPYCSAPFYANTDNTSSDFSYRTKTVKDFHVVKRGENLASVAYKFNCSVADIKKWNKLRSGKVVPGKKLAIISTITEKVPVAKNTETDSEENEQVNSADVDQAMNATEPVAKAVPARKAKTKAVAAVQPKSKYIIYVVQPGDTLSSIAKRYEVSNIAQLKAVNKITNGHLLKVGAKIKVPVSS